MTEVLALDQLTKRFPGPRPGTSVHALSGVSLSLSRGETVAVVGESGSGKSTLGRIALRLERPTSGRVRFEERDITGLPARTLRPMRARMQMVFQDPWGTLNPRMTIRALLEEPFLLHTALSRAERRHAAATLADRVRLAGSLLDRHPAQLSGGQLQRVTIARAVATGPRLLVLDEPTSSLDLSIRAEIIALLAALQREADAASLFISHDLATLRLIADRLVVLYLGRVMETGPAARIFARPEHPYTQILFSAQLPANPAIPRGTLRLTGDAPSALDPPPGCVFHTRCPVALPACRSGEIVPTTLGGGHQVACIRVADACNRIPT